MNRKLRLVVLLSSIIVSSISLSYAKTASYGEEVVLNYSVSGATSCDSLSPSNPVYATHSITPNTSGSVSGTKTYTASENSNFTLQCHNGSLSASDSDTLTVVKPDLTVSSLSPTTGTVNTASTLQVTVTNSGSGSLVNGTSQTRFQRSSSSSGSSPTTIGTHSITGSGAPGISYPASVSFTPTSAGVYYIQACTDSGSQISESNENNNCTAWTSFVVSSTATPPDLTSGTIQQTTATVNTAVTLTAPITNNGGSSTGSSFSNFIQVASAAGGTGTITNKTATTMSALGSGGSGQTSASHTFTAAGTYSARACADKSSPTNTGTITESDENNNCGSWTNITVSTTPSTSCNLPWGGTISSGQSVTAYNTTSATSPDVCTNHDETRTCNNGVLSGSYTNQSCTDQGSGSTGTINAPNCTIAAGASTCTTTVTWSSSGVSSVGVNQDGSRFSTSANSSATRTVGYTSSTFEIVDRAPTPDVTLDSDNARGNCASGSGWNGTFCEAGYGPDLVAGAISPTTATRNVSTTFSSTITNQGQLTTGGSFRNFIQVATGPDGTGTITDLSNSSMSTLAAGASSNTSRSYTFTSDGTYSMRACADKRDSDDNGDIDESNENNNCGSWTNINVGQVSCALPWGGTIQNGQSVTAYNMTSAISPDLCTNHDETRTCNNGVLSGSYTFQSCTDIPAPEPSFQSFNITPRTIPEDGLIKIVWNISYPDTTCQIIPEVQMPAACDASCQALRAAEEDLLVDELTTSYTNANDPYGSRLMTEALQTAASGTSARGEKSIRLKYSTSFTASCGETSAAIKTLIYVTEKTEG